MHAGGDIWLESTKICTLDSADNSGTEFRFRLPGDIVKLEPSEVRELRRSSASSDDEEAYVLFLTAAKQGMDVHVVEDSALIRKSIIKRLEVKISTCFYETTAAGSKN